MISTYILSTGRIIYLHVSYTYIYIYLHLVDFYVTCRKMMVDIQSSHWILWHMTTCLSDMSWIFCVGNKD